MPHEPLSVPHELLDKAPEPLGVGCEPQNMGLNMVHGPYFPVHGVGRAVQGPGFAVRRPFRTRFGRWRPVRGVVLAGENDRFLPQLRHLVMRRPSPQVGKADAKIVRDIGDYVLVEIFIGSGIFIAVPI